MSTRNRNKNRNNETHKLVREIHKAICKNNEPDNETVKNNNSSFNIIDEFKQDPDNHILIIDMGENYKIFKKNQCQIQYGSGSTSSEYLNIENIVKDAITTKKYMEQDTKTAEENKDLRKKINKSNSSFDKMHETIKNNLTSLWNLLDETNMPNNLKYLPIAIIVDNYRKFKIKASNAQIINIHHEKEIITLLSHVIISTFDANLLTKDGLKENKTFIDAIVEDTNNLFSSYKIVNVDETIENRTLRDSDSRNKVGPDLKFLNLPILATVDDKVKVECRIIE